MADLFGESRFTKGRFQRALLLYGKNASKIGSKEHLDNIIKEQAEYDATSGGPWGYDNLYTALRQIAKGAKVSDVLQTFDGLKGLGEKEAKTTILKKIVSELPIEKSIFREIGNPERKIADSVVLPVYFDVVFRSGNTTYYVFIYPRSRPVKQISIEALVSEYAQPFIGIEEEAKFVFVENPIVSGTRRPSVKIFDFAFREVSKEFRLHLLECNKVMLGSD
jgi:hypothetical protein